MWGGLLGGLGNLATKGADFYLKKELARSQAKQQRRLMDHQAKLARQEAASAVPPLQLAPMRRHTKRRYPPVQFSTDMGMSSYEAMSAKAAVARMQSARARPMGGLDMRVVGLGAAALLVVALVR